MSFLNGRSDFRNGVHPGKLLFDLDDLRLNCLPPLAGRRTKQLQPSQDALASGKRRLRAWSGSSATQLKVPNSTAAESRRSRNASAGTPARNDWLRLTRH